MAYFDIVYSSESSEKSRVIAEQFQLTELFPEFDSRVKVGEALRKRIFRSEKCHSAQARAPRVNPAASDAPAASPEQQEGWRQAGEAGHLRHCCVSAGWDVEKDIS